MIRPFALRGLVIVLAAALWIGAVASAQAQATYEDAKLEAFVTAAIKIDRLIETLTPRIRAAATPEEALKLRQEANEELVQVVDTTEGISVEEYQEINLAARSDAGLYARIEEIYKRQLAQ